MLNIEDFHEQGDGGYYNDHELGITIRYAWDEEAKLFTAVSSDVLGISTVAFTRDGVVSAFIKKYHATWTLKRINVLRSRVKLGCDDPKLTKDLLDALTDLAEFALKADFGNEIKEIFDLDGHFVERKKAAYYSVTLFLISVAATAYVIDVVRSLFN